MPLYCKGIDFENTYDVNQLIKNLDNVGISTLDSVDHLYMANWISDQFRNSGLYRDDAEQLFSRIYLDLDASSLFSIKDTLINPGLNPMLWKKTWQACMNEDRLTFLIDGFIQYGKQQCMQQRIAQRGNVWSMLSEILSHDDFTASFLLTAKITMDIDLGFPCSSYIERFKHVWNLSPMIDIEPYTRTISTVQDITPLMDAAVSGQLDNENGNANIWIHRQFPRVINQSEFKARPHLAIESMLFIRKMGEAQKRLCMPQSSVELPFSQWNFEI